MTKLPTVIDGVPYCNDACPAYDINTCRCEIVVYRPEGLLCEPSVRDMLATIADLRDRINVLADYVCEECSCTAVEIATDCGELEYTQFCEDCLRIPKPYWCPNAIENPLGEDAAASVSRFCRALAGRRLIP